MREEALRYAEIRRKMKKVIKKLQKDLVRWKSWRTFAPANEERRFLPHPESGASAIDRFP